MLKFTTSISFINFAGFPPTIEFILTSFVTTAPAAIIAPSEIVTPGRIVAFDPIHTLFPIFTGFGIIEALSSGF